MKLFQRLLVAPAAIGMITPLATHAAELNLSGVNQYASSEQVTSINQFSDVNPSDWAYQALSNLIERYGCVAGYPDGTYRGQRAMTRYEAAALLNACLDRITEITDELKKLMKEFEKELAVIRGPWTAWKPRWVSWKPLGSPPPPNFRVRRPSCWAP